MRIYLHVPVTNGINAKAIDGKILEDKIVKKDFYREILQHNENIFENSASSNIQCFVICRREGEEREMQLYMAQKMEYSLLEYEMYVSYLF